MRFRFEKILILLIFTSISLIGNQKMKISLELQYFEGCPNVDSLNTNIEKAIKKFKGELEYRKVEVTSIEIAKQKNFRGSPTLLINEEDIENQDIPKEIGLTCRYYQNGIPTVDDILNKIDSILNRKGD